MHEARGRALGLRLQASSFEGSSLRGRIGEVYVNRNRSLYCKLSLTSFADRENLGSHHYAHIQPQQSNNAERYHNWSIAGASHFLLGQILIPA